GMVRASSRDGQAGERDEGGRWADRRRGEHGGAGAGDSGAERIAAGSRRRGDGPVHLPRLSLFARGRAAHQLPLAEEHALHVGLRAGRTGAYAGGLPRGRRRTVSVLLLWRRDADRVALFSDLLLAVSQVEVADGAVEVERPFFHALEGLQIERPFVDGVLDVPPDAASERNEVVDRVHGDIEQVARTVPDGQRGHQRQHQIAALPPAPDSERLPGVLVALLNAELILGDVGHARAPEGGVDDEARQLPAGAVPFALEHAVHEPLREADEVEYVVDEL